MEPGAVSTRLHAPASGVGAPRAGVPWGYAPGGRPTDPAGVKDAFESLLLAELLRPLRPTQSGCQSWSGWSSDLDTDPPS